MEAALYKCMLKPLRDAIYTQLLEFRTHDGTVGRLREHQATMKQQSLGELGVTACVPEGAGLDRIRTKLNLLHQAYSPKKKEVEMLKVCKMLYEAMNQAAGRTGMTVAFSDWLKGEIYIQWTLGGQRGFIPVPKICGCWNP